MRFDNRDNGPVTMVDVAKAAGVAPSTVSYVITGKRSISAETRRQVERSVRDLGYHPHAGARALSSSRTNVLALVVPMYAGHNVAVVMQFVSSVATAARAHDYDLLLLTKDEGADGLRRVTSSAIVDAVIVMDIESADPRIPVLRSLDRPAVLIGAPDQVTGPTGLTCVDLDFVAAGACCVNHLADLGHRALALVGHAPAVYQRGSSYAGRFLRGFTEAAQARGVRARSRACGLSYDDVRACLDDLFTKDPKVTGIVVQNESVLPSVMSDLRQRGRRVPEDLSVIAVCPESMAENYAVALTTMAIPATELGELAVEMTIRQLDHFNQAKPRAKMKAPLAPETRLLSPQLVQRDSTARPPKT